MTSPSRDDVLLAFQAQFPGLLGSGLALVGDEILVGDDLGADEAVLEVGVNDARGLRRGRARVHRPGAHLFHAGGEIGLQAEQRVAAANHAVEAGLIEFQFRQKIGAVGLIELRNLRLDGRANRHHDRAFRLGNLTDAIEPWDCW